MTVYEFRREIEHAPDRLVPTGIETLTVRADAADIAVIMTLVRDRLIADMPPASVSAAVTCVACGASTADGIPVDRVSRKCSECVAAGFYPLDGPS